MKKIKLLLCVLFMALFNLSALANDDLPKNFETIYQEILNNKEYANLGNPEGKYVIIDFFDYRCQHCKRNRYQISELIQSGKVPNLRWISIEVPLFGSEYYDIAYLIQAAKAQEKYQELFKKIAALSPIAPGILVPQLGIEPASPARQAFSKHLLS